MDAIEAILTRRSVRAYEDRPIEREKLDTLLECAINSPSANNAQNWHFTLITNAALLREFEDEFTLRAPELGDEWARRVNDGYKVLHGAPAAILISAPDARDINAGVAAQSICVAARALGLGSCIIGLVRVVFGGPNGAKWARELLCPASLKPALMVTLGYPKSDATRERALKADLISRI